MNYEDNIVRLYRRLATDSSNNQSTLSARLDTIEDMMYDSFTQLMQLWRNRNKDNTDESGLPRDFVPPSGTIYTNCMEMVAYLTNVYVYKNPLIPISEIPNAMHISQAIRNKIQQDSLQNSWALELIKVIQNAVIYNTAPCEIRLTGEKETTLKSLSVQNVFWDDVNPSKVHLDAMYAGYTELSTTANLYRQLMLIPDQFRSTACKAILKDISTLERVKIETRGFTSSFEGGYKYSKFLDKFHAAVGGNGGKPIDGTDWTNLFNNYASTHDELLETRYKRMFDKFQVTTMYLRTNSISLSLPEKVYATYDTSARAGLPVYRITLLNHTVLLAVEPVTEQHGMLPIIIGQTSAGGYDSPVISYSESLAPVQVFVDKMMTARMQALRRALVGKDIYDAQAIDGKLLADKTTSSIPVDSHALANGKSIDMVYKHIPFDSSGLSALLGMINDPNSWADRVSGNNPQMRGGRIQGNKLAVEAQQEAQASEGRFKVYSIVFQQTFMLPFKFILRSNLAEATDKLVYFDALANMPKSVTLSEYKQNEIAFDMADGAIPSNKTVSPDIIATLATMIIQIPELRQLKDLPTLVGMLASSAGFEGFSQIPPPSTATVQRMQSYSQAQTQQPTGSNTSSATEATGQAVTTDKQAQ